MVETILILTFSVALFAYWLRYTILLLLSEEQVGEHSTVISQLSVLEVREALRQPVVDIPLDRLHRALDKDYRMLCFLLNHASDMEPRPAAHHLLMLDYRIMHLWFCLTRNASARQARRALDEMAGVLTYIAYKMGERPAGFSQA
jgi:hypothetical protein